MNQPQTCTWTGRSGNGYTHFIYPISTPFDAVPGNYIFAKETSPNRWTAVYIGQTTNLSERFDYHHKMPCIRREGATHIHAHRNDGGEQARRLEETDLIATYNPPCNR